MEFSIFILDTFPSLNKLAQKNDLLLELNNKEYDLKKIITQQDIISIKEIIADLNLKVYVLSDNKKVLIGENQINLELFNIENKCSIFWLEFKKKIEENRKEINDINLLFYDCIRLKIKILPIKIILKTDKKIKTNKSKLKFCSPNDQKKNKKIYDIKENANLANSCRVVNENNCLLKSNSLKENIRLTKINIDESNVKLTENKTNIIMDEIKLNNIMDKYKNLEIDPKKSISQDIKDLKLENEVLLTDNNILENYSFSTSQGDNNKNNIIDLSNMKKAEIKNNNNIFKRNNNSINYELRNSLLSPNNFNKIIKNIIFKSNEENKNSNIKKDNSFSDINIIKGNEKYNNSNTNTIKKIKTHHKKTKSLNKIIYNNDMNNIIKTKKCTYNNKMNLKNKSNHLNINKSLSRENLLHSCYTLNDFYNSKILKNSLIENSEIEKINIKYKGLKERKMTTDNLIKNNYLNDLLISKNKEISIKNDTIEEVDINQEYNNEEEKNNIDEFSSIKKDYELFYTLKFIENIKNDLLDLEFNIALDKSISLFKLYNKKVISFYQRRKDLINIINNYINKIGQLHKKIDFLNLKKRRDELKEKKKLLRKRSTISYTTEILSQKKILENLVVDKINKKEQLKSIVESLIKKQPLIQETLEKIKRNKKEKEKEEEKKLFNKSPVKRVYKNQFKSKKIKDISKKKQMNLSENKSKNKIKKNCQEKISVRKVKNRTKLNLKKNKSVTKTLAINNNTNKNLIKNNSINNLLNNRNTTPSENVINKESKSNDNNNNLHFIRKEFTNGKNNTNSIFYSTARTKFYNKNFKKLK